MIATIPVKATTYVCESFELPNNATLHITQISAIVTSALIHHVVIHGCSTNSSWVQSHISNPQECYTANGSIPMECNDVLWAWTPGMGPLVLPSQVGFKASHAIPEAYKYILIQTHYSNPGHLLGSDNSQYVITFTPQLRANDAGVLMLGDPFITANSIPPQESFVHYEFSCSPACTNNFTGDITLFADFLHMHQIGSRMYSTQWRGTENLGIINSVDFWDFDFQQTTMVNRVIKRGDRINTQCMYDSSNKVNVTTFGLATDSEMCVEFLYYYPKMYHFDVCGYYRKGNQNFTACGAFDLPSAVIINERNPVAIDGVNPVSFASQNGMCGQLESSSHVGIVMGVSVGAMVGVCLLSVVIIVGMMGGLLFIAMKTKDENRNNNHTQFQDEEEEDIHH